MTFINKYKYFYKRMIKDLNNNNYLNDVDDIVDLSNKYNIPIKYTLPRWEWHGKYGNGRWILDLKSQQKALKRYLND